MDYIFPILEQLLLMAVLISLGFYLSRTSKINQAAEKGIAELTIDIAFPALIFANIVKDFNLNMLKRYLIMPVSSFIITASSIMIIIIITKLLKYPKKEVEEIAFVTSFSNNIFIGAPICLAVFGSQGLILAILYDFGMHLVVWTGGIWLLNNNKEDHQSNFLGNIFSPPIIALLISITVVILGINVPDFVVNITESIGNITVPLAMIFIGLKLAKSRFREIVSNKKIFLVSFLRLLFFPALVYFVLSFFSLPALLSGVITLLAAMPVFASSPVIMRKYGHKSDFASEAIFATIILMIFTMPLFIYILI